MLERHLAQIEAVEKKVFRSVAMPLLVTYSQAVWVNRWSFTLYYVCMGYLLRILFKFTDAQLKRRDILHGSRTAQALLQALS